MTVITTLTVSRLIQSPYTARPLREIIQIPCSHFQTPHNYTTNQVREDLKSNGFDPVRTHKQTVLYSHPITQLWVEIPKKPNKELSKHTLSHIYKTINETLEQLALRAFFFRR
jgi:predicted RNA binding protein YcfA (HicA-like mRNA interferase family)